MNNYLLQLCGSWHYHFSFQFLDKIFPLLRKDYRIKCFGLLLLFSFSLPIMGLSKEYDERLFNATSVQLNNNKKAIIDISKRNDLTCDRPTTELTTNFKCQGRNVIKKYRLLNVDPICSEISGYGVIFQRATGCSGQRQHIPWQANEDLHLSIFEDGNANISGTVFNENRVGIVNLDITNPSTSGHTYTAPCYTSNLSNNRTYFARQSGTIKIEGTTFTIRTRTTELLIGNGASNDGNGFGLGAWTRGSFGDCTEWFANLQEIAICDEITYQWSNGATTASITVDQAGTYSVTATDCNGCTGSSSITVNETIDEPTISLVKSSDLSCTNNIVTLSANINEGQVQWSTGQIGNSIQVNSTGTYSATITTANGCTASATIIVSGGCNPCAIELNVANKVCNNNDTPSNPTDDTYTFDVLVTGTGTSPNGFILNYSNPFIGTTTQDAQYGQVITLGPFPAGSFTATNVNPPVTITDGLDINVSVEDKGDNNCRALTVVQSPGTCSNTLNCPDGSPVKTPGTSCDDFNPNTQNDVIQTDGCSCQGTLTDDLCRDLWGDTDGDGVCDDEDNCRITFNPSQADVNNNGIGDMCEGLNGPNACKDLFVSGGNRQINIAGIVSPNALIEYQGVGTGWALVGHCNANCGATTIIPNLQPGDYKVKVQTFNPYCYAEYTIKVTDGVVIDPCANQGGDSDGDGICNNQDNCDFTRNPDQADNDGDGIGNVCDDTPNGNDNNNNNGSGSPDDCKGLSVSSGNGSFTISGIKANSTKIEYNGPSTGWAIQSICDGNCSRTQTVTGLAVGDYTIKVQTFNPYCYAEYKVTVTAGSIGGGNPCDSQGGDSDQDGVCDNEDNCDFTSNPDQADNDGDGIGNACDDTPNGDNNNNGSGSPDDCEGLSVSSENGSFTISGIKANSTKIEYNGPSTGWAIQPVCDGNCGNPQTVNGLTAGDYTIKVQTFNPYCYASYQVTITAGSNVDPCVNQGGDSDGDGICNNQDNCDFTFNPDQADNDADGIGNACDDTPNGDPCANRGGDSDGDEICGFDDCNDNDVSIGIKQPIGTFCNDGDSNTVNDQIQADGCTCLGEIPVCEITRTVSNSTECVNRTKFGISFHGYYTISNGLFTETSRGTAKLTGHANNLGDININFTGRTFSGTPLFNPCQGNQNTQDWYYYEDFSGTIGNIFIQSDSRHIFQVGSNANNHQNGYGASGWFSANGSVGDINILLSGNANTLNTLSSIADCSAVGRSSKHLSFEAFIKQRKVALQWATNTGYKNDYYIIERSLDGITFETLEQVENLDLVDEVITFNSLDPTPMPGSNYYRVKQVFQDGTFEYTETKEVHFNVDLEKIAVYPNPVENAVFVHLKPLIGQKATIKIANQFGQIVKQFTIEEANATPVQIEMNEVPNGLYILTVKPQKGSKTLSKKILVSRLY